MKRLGAIGIAVATTFLVPGVAEGEASDTGPDHWCPAGASVDFLEPEDTWPFLDCKDDHKKPPPPTTEQPPTTKPPEEPPPPKEPPPPPPRVKPAPPVPGKPAFTG